MLFLIKALHAVKENGAVNGIKPVAGHRAKEIQNAIIASPVDQRLAVLFIQDVGLRPNYNVSVSEGVPSLFHISGFAVDLFGDGFGLGHRHAGSDTEDVGACAGMGKRPRPKFRYLRDGGDCLLCIGPRREDEQRSNANRCDTYGFHKASNILLFT